VHYGFLMSRQAFVLSGDPGYPELSPIPVEPAGTAPPWCPGLLRAAGLACRRWPVTTASRICPAAVACVLNVRNSHSARRQARRERSLVTFLAGSPSPCCRWC